jgi:hypothetical protein
MAAAAAATSSSNPWVPVIAAAVGAGAALIVGVITALTAGHRETVRWERERTAREKQWERERDERRDQWGREDSLRWVQTRQQAYAQLVADLRTWDSELLGLLTVLKLDKQFGTDTNIDKTEAEQAQHAARDALTLAEFLAPDPVAGQARMAFRFFELMHQAIRSYPTLPPGGVGELQELWDKAVSARMALERSMRDDLGLAGVPVTPQPGTPPAAPASQAMQTEAGRNSAL